MTEGFILDLGLPGERRLAQEEVAQVLESIHEEICREGVQYSHTYGPGDFIISDNLAVGHEADPATQLPREEVNQFFCYHVNCHLMLLGAMSHNRWV